MVLFNHFDNEIVLLLGFNIKESQVMQFLSDQLMRIVREVHKEMRVACVVDLSQSNRAVMCARIALCSIRACLKMNEFVKADISRHPVLQHAYMQFLTRCYSEQRSLAVPPAIKPIETKVKALEGKLAEESAARNKMKEEVSKVKSSLFDKLNSIVAKNDLKK